MTDIETIQIENEIFTKIVMDEFRKQKAAGVKEYLLDKYAIDKETKERLRKILSEYKGV